MFYIYFFFRYEKIFCSLVQQACEKMDKIRSHAGLILSQLLYHK